MKGLEPFVLNNLDGNDALFYECGKLIFFSPVRAESHADADYPSGYVFLLKKSFKKNWTNGLIYELLSAGW